MKRHRSDIPHIIDPDVLDVMLDATAPLVPPSGLRARVLAGIDANRQTLVTVHSDEAPWQTLSHGVEFKLLWFDSQVRIKSFLLRAAAGTRFPRHGHQGPEECLVLEGDCVIGALQLRIGDFHSASKQAVHEDAYTENGFLMYLRTHIDDHPLIRPNNLTQLPSRSAAGQSQASRRGR